jgi:hydroxymethylpyrimidine/phosphomethylpyrimidine kinase
VIPVALTIAGSDPSGGAGIQADLKTFHRFGVYGEAVVTLITVQNTRGVGRVEVLSLDLVAEQIRSVVSDIAPAAAKTGALGNAGVVRAVAAERLKCPVVVDPVLISTNGVVMLDAGARRAFTENLLPHAFLLTPNLPEAEMLTGLKVHDRESMIHAAEKLRSMGAANILIKGGHLTDDALDILLTESGAVHEFSALRVASSHTHGTGCAYSAAITAQLAKGRPLVDAVASAKTYVTEAIRTAPGLGSGSGPLNHFAR